VKKLLLAILLIVLILGASYLKTVLDENKIDQIEREVARKSTDQLRDLKVSIDSLQSGMERTKMVLVDSIRLLKATCTRETDSLNDLLVAQSRGIKQASSVPNSDTAGGKLAANTSRLDSLDFHHKVLVYYRKRYEALPGDLSRYESRVALSEIRQETALRFNISIDDLNEIRNKNNLDY